MTAAALLTCSLSASVLSGSLEQAKRIHERLAGIAPDEATLLSMKADIDDGNVTDAALTAMENDNFYNVTIKNWAAPWTNREFDVFVPLNDYSATVIGLVRDSEIYDFREVLYGDHIYVGKDSLPISDYGSNDNDHYVDLEEGGYSLKDDLEWRSQASVTGLPSDATAGVVTTRAAAKAFFVDGTNRAQFRFTLINHLCLDLEQLHDTSRVPDRIRQDVSRSPGGDSRAFLGGCMGCHAGMDPLTQAFAYYDYVYAENDEAREFGAIEYNSDIDEETGSRVQPKYFNNDATFAQGFRTPDDKWINYWRQGPNSALQWDSELTGQGEGARSMLTELAHSEQFASCQVKKVFKSVCLRDPADGADVDKLGLMVDSFKSSGYNIKTVFAESADYCKGP